MLRDEIELYTKLTGKDGQHTPICVIGAYIDGYEKGKEEKQTNTAEWEYKEIPNTNIIGWWCSNCHIGQKSRTPYCPECGAKMTREE